MPQDSIGEVAKVCVIISGASHHGLSLLHGNAKTFHGSLPHKELSFQLIYEFWRNFTLGEDNLAASLHSLGARLGQLVVS